MRGRRRRGRRFVTGSVEDAPGWSSSSITSVGRARWPRAWARSPIGCPPAATAQAPVPTRWRFAASAWSQRWDSRTPRRARTALSTACRRRVGCMPGVLAARPSCGAPGSRRRIAVVSIERAGSSSRRARLPTTVGDVIRVAIAAALARCWPSRVETSTARHGRSGLRPPGGRRFRRGSGGSPCWFRSRRTARITDRLRQRLGVHPCPAGLATGPPPIAVVPGWLFRPLAALGVYRWCLNHQRRFHTLVTTVRGPERVLRFAGCLVTSATPISPGDNGNVTIHCSVLSYAGRLPYRRDRSDPDRFPNSTCSPMR